MPLFQTLFPFSKLSKEHVTFDLWTRETIIWDIACEKEMPRKKILDAFSNVNKTADVSFKLINYGAIVLGGFTILGWFCQSCCCLCNYNAQNKQQCKLPFIAFLATVIV